MALHFLSSDATSAGVGETLALVGAEAKHALVRRLRVGEQVTLGDGAGVWLTGEVAEASPERVEVRIDTRVEQPAPSPRLVLAQALAKGDRDEMAVQAACELGVDEIVPWQAARSVSRWEGVKAAKGRERWESILREAAKQAHRAWIPEVTPVATTGELSKRPERVLVLDPVASVQLTSIASDGRDILIVVGPEGGIGAEEFAELTDAGAERVRLGDTVLRTSTAGPAAIAVLSATLGRW